MLRAPVYMNLPQVAKVTIKDSPKLKKGTLTLRMTFNHPPRHHCKAASSQSPKK